jgi:hypothetical protein
MNLQVWDKTQNFSLANSKPVFLNYYNQGPFNHYNTGFNLSGEFRISSTAGIFTLKMADFMRKPDCFQNWNTGLATVIGETGKIWNLEMDPFGNQSCDIVFKVSQKTTTGLMEEAVNAW